MVPVYSIFTFISLIFYRHFFTWTMARNFYESYTVYSFYWLLRFYLGDSTELQLKTMKHYYMLEVDEKHEKLIAKKNAGTLTRFEKHSLAVTEDFYERQRLNILPFLNGQKIKWMEYDPFSERYHFIFFKDCNSVSIL